MLMESFQAPFLKKSGVAISMVNARDKNEAYVNRVKDANPTTFLIREL